MEDESETLAQLLSSAGGGDPRVERKAGRIGERCRIARAESLWAEALAGLGRHAEAEPLLLASHQVLQRERGPLIALTQEARARAVELHERWGRPAALEEWRQPTGPAAAAEPAVR